MPQTTPAHLLVLAKAPVPGRVKTRLQSACSPAEAAAVAEAALADTLEAVAACGAERRIVALDGDPGPWLPPGFEVVPQVDGPFERRLAAAWAAAGGPGLQIGMDTPQVDADLLDRCLAELFVDDTDAVLGPAPDGGWWAIGLRRPHPDVFRGVPMSVPETFARQHERLLHRGLRTRLLPEVRDIDRPDDVADVCRRYPHLRTAVAASAAGLLEGASR